MKSYEIITACNYPNEVNEVSKTSIIPDDKKEGLYKVIISFSNDGYKKVLTLWHGKVNQPRIQKMILLATEV